jgi:cell division initiation protein
MSVTPEDIRGYRFSLRLGGYKRDEVDSFVAEVAESFQAVLAAEDIAREPALARETSSLTLEATRKAAADIVRQAEEDVDSIRRHAAEQAAATREHAADEASAVTETTRRRAAELLVEARSWARAAKVEAERVRRLALAEVAQMRANAAEEAAATHDAAYERAAAKLEEAERRTRDLIGDAQAEAHARLDEIQPQLAAFQSRDEELRGQFVEMNSLLQKMLDHMNLLMGLTEPHHSDQDVGDSRETRVC